MNGLMKKLAKKFKNRKTKTIGAFRWMASTITKVVIGLLIGIYLGLYWLPSYFASQQVESVEVITSDMIYTRIEQVSELIATKYYYTDAVIFKDFHQFNGLNLPWTQKRFVVSYDGVISAGIDLQEIDIKIDETTIKIKLPQAKIIAHEINETRVLDESDGLFNHISIEDQANVLKNQKTSMEIRAVQNGLLTQTQTDAKQVIEKLVLPEELQAKGYQIEFVEE